MSTHAACRAATILALAALWLWMGSGEPLAATPKGTPAPATKTAPAAKKASSDSADGFLPLARRTLPTGLLFSALVDAGDGIWAVGDSGLIAFSSNDTIFTRLDPPDHLPLHCAGVVGRALICAGDSGRVFRVADGRVQRADFRDTRTVRDISFLGDAGLLGGDAGLLARSLDGGRSWDTLAAPLPMRFTCVLVQEDGWWAGGAGGRLYFSPDRGLGWRSMPLLPAPLADLVGAGAGAVIALDRTGGLHHIDGQGARRIGRAEVGQAQTLAVLPGGWAVGGEGGRVAVLDTGTDRWRLGRLDVPTVVSALLARGPDLLLGGAWSTLALWRQGDEQPTLLRHSLAAPLHEEAAVAALSPAAPKDTLALPSPSGVVVGSGPRCFQNVLDTEARCTTSPTRLGQLGRSYDNTRWLGVMGRAMLALDISAGGRLEDVQVLDEWPEGLGVGAQARQLANSLTFTPGFRGSAMVDSRMLFPVVFPGSDADFQSWARGDRDAGALLDSLVDLRPKASSSLSPKALVKAMGFPRKARRYVWEGQAVLEYRLAADGEISRTRVLWESEAKYGFGAHTQSMLSKLRMTLPEGITLAPGDHLRVVQRFNFDRKRYRRAAREEERGFAFAPVLTCNVESDSARYEPGLAQLEWLLNDFHGATGEGAWPAMDLSIIMRHDGRLQDFSATPVPGDAGLPAARELNMETLRGLALLFTWGRPAARGADQLDTLALRWEPAAFVADSMGTPPGLKALLHEVVY